MKIKQNIPYIVFGIGVAALAGAATYVLSESFRNSVGKVLGKKKVGCNSKFLFIGDSNTKTNWSYADKLKSICPNAVVVKLAENGMNTSWMLNKLTEELSSGKKYDVISILGGSNDIYGGMSLDKTEQNLNDMYDLAKRSGAITVAIAPPNKDFYDGRTDEKQVKLYDLVKWMAANKKPNYFINFHKLTNNKQYFTQADNYLHPQSNAHAVLLNEFKKRILA